MTATPTAKMWEVWRELFKRKRRRRTTKLKAAMTKIFGFRFRRVRWQARISRRFRGVMESYYRMGKEAFHAGFGEAA